MSLDVTGRLGARLLRAVALSVGLGATALPGAAHAQFFGWAPWGDSAPMDGLRGPQVRRRITEQGFRVLGPLRRNGEVFVADVIDRRGRHERLIVASADAQILQRFFVDDGRGPNLYARGDDGEGLVPPADIPGAARPGADRPAALRPAPRRYGDLDGEDTPGAAVIEPPAPRGQPPIKTVKPRPRVVERTPDGPVARDPTVDSTPLAPAAQRPRAVEPPKTAEPARVEPPKTAEPVRTEPKAPATVASRPDEPAAAPTTSASPSRRLSDPLAIPGGPAKPTASAPVRSVSGNVTGAPAPEAKPADSKPADSKPGDVPAAPLD